MPGSGSSDSGCVQQPASPANGNENAGAGDDAGPASANGNCEHLDKAAANANAAAVEQLLKWEKLSPAEFQQLQDYAACKYLGTKISKTFVHISMSV